MRSYLMYSTGSAQQTPYYNRGKEFQRKNTLKLTRTPREGRFTRTHFETAINGRRYIVRLSQYIQVS